ncbi:hypothetical protein GLOIN_2v1738235 [Rhizophagus clarus]|uniref:Uncharacterized protein n=1 Tax=Rhizophagus clarus TaxID=94130 RepID=A0A8H3M1Z9_9GLOM|nr:hypothetical protein GLOIN_2v1738235 [Rhizophagus clarus]
MSSGADNITLQCLIVPCGGLHSLPRDQVVQTVTVGRSQKVSVLEAAIQSRLGAPFNTIRLKIRQVYPNEAPMQAQDLISTFFNEQPRPDYFHYLEKVLQEDYKISSGDITLIPQFKPVICPVDENSPEFKLCIDDILRKIRNMGPVVDSNEAIRCEYISTILHTALSLLEGLIITPQMKITGEINTGRVDYAIKKILDDLLEEIICITEGKQNQATMGICQNLLQCRSACDMNINMNKKK